jgi:hypothetical protein
MVILYIWVSHLDQKRKGRIKKGRLTFLGYRNDEEKGEQNKNGNYSLLLMKDE